MLKKVNTENKMIFHDLSSINDPNFQVQQILILYRRLEQQKNQQEPLPLTSSFGRYFNYLSGFGSCLPDF